MPHRALVIVRASAALMLGLSAAGAAPTVPSVRGDTQPTATAKQADRAVDPQASLPLLYRPEVRLRKLHLVRPDLIPYPIAYEVYC